MLLRVDLPEGPFVADVGFGGDGLVLPVPLDGEHEVFAGEVGTPGRVGHRMVREGGEDHGFPSRILQACLDGEWQDLYAFTLEPQHAVDYEMANHYTSTYPRSHFVLSLTAQRARRHRRAILRNRELVVREEAGVRASSVRDPDHLLEILATEFDLVFPPGTRFSSPEAEARLRVPRASAE
jgi:N-hydroxyarylamine O-acetyltransferase